MRDVNTISEAPESNAGDDLKKEADRKVIWNSFFYL